MSNKNVEFVNLSKTFVSGDQNFTALENVNFNINENDFSVCWAQAGVARQPFLIFWQGLRKALAGKQNLMAERYLNHQKKGVWFFRRIIPFMIG